MIPKIIHYCWFGSSPLDKSSSFFIKRWKELLPEYDIIRWDEKNFDIESNNYVKQAYAAKKWAFVSDYVRLKVLYEYGGIYLDTDVELLKKFDDLLENKCFFCSESKYSICTAVIGAEKHSLFISELLEIYRNKVFKLGNSFNLTPNSKIVYEFLKSKYDYSTSINNISKFESVSIYPSFYFSPISCYDLSNKINDKTIAIHRFSSSWKTKNQKIKDYLLVVFTKIFGEELREKLRSILKRN